MPAALHSRDYVLDRLLATFRASGYDGASLADIASATGLGRSSLYHHFPGGKEEMATAVLDRVDAWLDANVIAPLRKAGMPAERLERMVGALDAFYDSGRNRCILAAFVVGQSRQLFGKRLAAVFERWIAALAAVACDGGVEPDEARRRAEAVVIAVQGAVVLAGALDDPKPFKTMLADLPRGILDGGIENRDKRA